MTMVAVSFTLARQMGIEVPSVAPGHKTIELAARTLMKVVDPRYDHEVLSLIPAARDRGWYLRAKTVCKGHRVTIESSLDSTNWWDAVATAYMSMGGWAGKMNQEAAKAALAIYAAKLGLQEIRADFDFRKERVLVQRLPGWRMISDWLDREIEYGVTPEDFLAFFKSTPRSPTLKEVDALGRELERMVFDG